MITTVNILGNMADQLRAQQVLCVFEEISAWMQSKFHPSGQNNIKKMRTCNGTNFALQFEFKMEILNIKRAQKQQQY